MNSINSNQKNYNSSTSSHYNLERPKELDNKENSNEYFNRKHPNTDELIEECNKKTLFNELKQSFSKFSNKDFLGYRKGKDTVSGYGEYTYLTYSQEIGRAHV